MTKLKSYDVILQDRIRPEDESWIFQAADLPSFRKTNAAKLVKLVTLAPPGPDQHVSIRLKLTDAPSNRITSSEPLHALLLLSTASFRMTHDPKEPNGRVETGTGRETADYLTRLCQSGLSLNGVKYNFFGHSNSQLKSRSCFFLAATKDLVTIKIEAMGDFSKCKTVGKKVKRIGQLFSSADMALDLDPARCEDINDVQRDGYVFTDGCGSISPALARHLVQRRNITYRGRRYLPSVFQIRYRGYKGVLTLDTSLVGNVVQVQFRESMRKFTNVKDLSFSVIGHSKPYSFGYLNDEIVLLLHALGISTETLTRKQAEHIEFLSSASSGDVQKAFRFLCYSELMDLAEKLLLHGIESVLASVKSLIRQEYAKMLNKHDEQRCRILIPDSRLLFGVCDPTSKNGNPGHLREGECFVRITKDGSGEPVTIINTEVLVTRNPCLHPGDLQKFRAVNVPEFAHLVDCIVFSTAGSRPSADLMSGGDLDGDKFFVTWDPEIVPTRLSEPALYPAGKERIEFKPITGDSRAEYFARFNNASMGRVKNLFMHWARLKGPLSSQCQELNRLFSQAVDGNRIKVPDRLQEPPEPERGGEEFVLDALHAASKEAIRSVMDRASQSTQPEDCFFEPTELCLSRQDFALSEFELINLTLRWCDKEGADFSQYTPYFNYRALSDEQQAWVLSRLPQTNYFLGLVRNGLLQSQLVNPTELKRFRLDHHNLHWKPVFDSATDRLARFLPALCQAMETFHKKLVIWRADERLTLAMYIPEKVERATETLVGARVRVFAFPRSQGSESPGYRVRPTKVNYRVYCEDAMFQLYDNKRANTWVFLTRGQMKAASFQNAATERDRRRRKQQTLDEGINFDCRSSVALDKIGRDIQTHVGGMNRAGVLGAEIYVISNRDVESMRLLDLWLDYVDTEQVHHLFDEEDVEYTIQRLRDLDLSIFPSAVAHFLTTRDVSTLADIKSLDELSTVLSTLKDYDEKVLLRDVYRWLLDHEPGVEGGYEKRRLVKQLLQFIPSAAYLALVFLESDAWETHKETLRDELDYIALPVAKQLILLLNDMRAFVRLPLQLLLREMKVLSVQNLSELIELVALSVRDPANALDILLMVLEPELGRLLVERPTPAASVAKALMGLALDHVEEAAEGKTLEDSLRLQPDGKSEGYQVVKSDIRVDSRLNGLLKQSDHVRIVVSKPPSNAAAEKRFMADAVVIRAQGGSASFRCMHTLPPYFQDCVWHVAHCGSFVTTKTAIDAVTKFYAEKEHCCGVFGPLVGIRGSSTPDHDVVQYTPAENLNESQNKALRASLTQPLTFLWGPPGSGKTHTIVTMLLKLLDGLPEQRILVTAPTHNAVDNILQKFIKEKGMERSGVQPLRVSTEVGKVASDIRKFTCDAMVGQDLHQNHRARNEAQKRVKASRLVFTTCAGAGLGLLRTELFAVVMVDEASQMTEPATLIPLVKGCRRAVLVGDHKQLRATVRTHAVVVDFDVSLFERLYAQPSENGGVARVMLDTQYRMHHAICDFSAREFYASQLRTAVPDAARPLARCRFPWPAASDARMLFVSCASPEDVGHSSKANRGQAELCKLVCESLTTAPAPGAGDDQDLGDTVGPFEAGQITVLTPYTRQKELLTALLPAYTVSSIDGYQGKEADVVVFVAVRCNTRGDMGFLGDLRRLNVAMTRARRVVIIIGDRRTLTLTDASGDAGESKACWRRLIDSCTPVEFPVVTQGTPHLVVPSQHPR